MRSSVRNQESFESDQQQELLSLDKKVVFWTVEIHQPPVTFLSHIIGEILIV